MTPFYYPGIEDLNKFGYEGSHEYGYTGFGYFKTLTVLRPGGGDYQQDVIQWGTCRDTFQATELSDLKKGFLFTHPANHGYDAACFLTKIESILEIEHSRFKLVGIDHITLCYPSPWWFTSVIRKSFLTLMCRSAYHYRVASDNFEQALFAINYTKETSTAVKKFLKGYTVYDYTPRDSADGWFQQFSINRAPIQPPYIENSINIGKMKPSPELIAKRAYELWLEKGKQDGYDKDQWLTAENQLLREAA